MGGGATSNGWAVTAGDAVWVTRPHMGGKPCMVTSEHVMNQDAEQLKDVSRLTNRGIALMSV